MILLLLLSTALWIPPIASNAEAQGSITNLPGAVAETLGQVYPVNQHAELQFDLGGVKMFIDNTKQQLKAIDVLANNVSNDTALTNIQKNILKTALFKLASKLQHFLHTPSNRTKRGLFNFVGTISHALFGTVDDDTFQSSLKEYNEKLKLVSSTFTASAKSINALRHNTIQLRAAYDDLAEHMARSEDVNAIARFSQLAFLINQYQHTFTSTVNAAMAFGRSINRAAHGQVDSELITPEDLQDTFSSIESLHNSRPLFSTSDRLLFFASLSAYLTHDGLSIIVPLEPQLTLVAYAIHPFPHKINNTLVTLNAPKLILKSLNGHSLATPSLNTFSSCLKPSKTIFVCLSPTWAYNTNNQTCEHAILSSHEHIHEHCTFTEHVQQDSPFVLPLQESTLLYYYKPSASTITCGKQLPMKIIQGPYMLPHKCELQSLSLHIPSFIQYVSWYTKHIQFQIPAPLVPFSLPKHQQELNITYVEVPKVDTPTYILSAEFAKTYFYPLGITLTAMIIFSVGLIIVSRYVRNSLRESDAINYV